MERARAFHEDRKTKYTYLNAMRCYNVNDLHNMFSPSTITTDNSATATVNLDEAKEPS